MFKTNMHHNQVINLGVITDGGAFVCNEFSSDDDSIVDEIYSLREAKQNAQVAGAEREGMKKRISEMQQFLAEQQQDITEYDEQLVRRLIEKITVYDERVTVEFKSGTSVDVRR